MKFEIDTTLKTITLRDFSCADFDELKKMVGEDFPQYRIVSETVYPNGWQNPFYVPYAPQPVIPYYGTTCLTIHGGDTSITTNADVPFTLTSGITNCCAGGSTNQLIFSTN